MERMERQPHGVEEEEEDDEQDDDNYAKVYLDDDDNDDDDDDDELAEMFAKVKTIQQAEGLMSASRTAQEPPPPASTNDTSKDKYDDSPRLNVRTIQTTPRSSSAGGAPGKRSKASTPTTPGSRSRSPSSATVTRSEDGIKTISRRPLGSAVGVGSAVRVDALLNGKKPVIYSDKLLQSVKSTDLIEKLKTKAVVAAPAKIGKRIEDLSAPTKKRTGRKFATDDEERHCRFKPRTAGSGQKPATDRDDDDYGGGSDSRNDFIARMEAAEKSKQKRLEMTRGENEYNARLDKRCCPKCLTPQSYSEYKDKKKRCQMCGVEFRVLQAWGDVGQDFIARMSDATIAKAEKQELIRAQVMQQETNAHRVAKTAKQQFYEKQMLQKNSQRTFLDRNYQANASTKTRQAAQAQLQLQIQTERAKLLAARCESPVV